MVSSLVKANQNWTGLS